VKLVKKGAQDYGKNGITEYKNVPRKSSAKKQEGTFSQNPYTSCQISKKQNGVQQNQHQNIDFSQSVNTNTYKEKDSEMNSKEEKINSASFMDQSPKEINNFTSSSTGIGGSRNSCFKVMNEIGNNRSQVGSIMVQE
jgi:hypothetical protein